MPLATELTNENMVNEMSRTSRSVRGNRRNSLLRALVTTAQAAMHKEHAPASTAAPTTTRVMLCDTKVANQMHASQPGLVTPYVGKPPRFHAIPLPARMFIA